MPQNFAADKKGSPSPENKHSQENMLSITLKSHFGRCVL